MWSSIFAKTVGIEKVAPHDLRRTCARLCDTAGGELEQIQFLLGHVSVQTTERYLIDICINNAIQFPSGGNTYAPTEGKCRFARGPSPAGAGPVGHGPVAERSGAPHPLCSEFGPALAAGTTPRGTRRFAGALLARTPAEVGRPPAPSLGEAASPGTPGARLPDAVVDHGPHRRSHPAGVRSALPSRSCRSADASPEVEPPET